MEEFGKSMAQDAQQGTCTNTAKTGLSYATNGMSNDALNGGNAVYKDLQAGGFNNTKEFFVSTAKEKTVSSTGAAVGSAAGAMVGGPVGAAVGSKIGEQVSSSLAKKFF